MNQPIKKRKTKLDKLKDLLLNAKKAKEDGLVERLEQMIRIEEESDAFLAELSGGQSRRSSKPEHNLGKKTC